MSEAGIKHYARVAVFRFKPGTADATIAQAEENLLPLFRRRPGFISHQIVKTGEDDAVAISTWDSAAGAAESVRVAAAWVEEHAREQLVSDDTRFGELVVDYERFHEGAYDAAGSLRE